MNGMGDRESVMLVFGKRQEMDRIGGDRRRGWRNFLSFLK